MSEDCSVEKIGAMRVHKTNERRMNQDQQQMMDTQSIFRVRTHLLTN